MNKQELIEKIGNLDKLYGEKFYVALDDVLDLVKQLDESEKVKIPQFVADWLKENDLREETLGEQSVFDVFDNLKNDSKNGYYENVKRWIDENRDLFARAWLDGYEVEEEKRYLVKVKGMNRINGCLAYNKKLGTWYFGISGNSKNHSTNHTRKELEEANFGWVFDCPGVEVEEVEE
ncbi:DUF1642 domain-containing protein [Streptococcus oralis]|uniref:DUF1642 domain-containing protein n=1 Tax=Streptococcus oralis TaxID=1303 RepID=UPI000A1217FA|nr:DUF1642 domain-containing protein [Streptococcus oralis]ORO68830.1 hypothetical protein B7713_02265 [Streptococcus oralis subsp. oralis]